jgi:long-chain acyl-CoA synthetase
MLSEPSIYDLEPWLQHDSGTRPAELPAPSHRNLGEFARDAARRHAAKTAFTTVVPNGMNGSLSYAEVERLSDAFAVWLREEAGLAHGERVALQMPNGLAYPVCTLGALKAGCVVVNTNPLYTAREMAHQFGDSGAKALVMTELFADKLAEVLPHTQIRKVVLASVPEFFPAVPRGIVRAVQRWWNRAIPVCGVAHVRLAQALAAGRRRLDAGASVEPWLAQTGPDDLAALQYTGGTTGVAKGAMLTHSNLLSNVQQVGAIAGSHLREGGECVLTALPLYHIFAFTVNLLAFYGAGARNVMVPSPRPVQNLQRALENYPITWITGVNTLFNALLGEEWFRVYPPRHLRASIAGGAALHASVAERWERVTGTPLAEGYGLTECSPVLTFNPLAGGRKPNSIGIPVPGTALRVVDEAGRPLPPGQPGELIANGPQVMRGYWNQPEETAKVLRGGWVATGDVATMDEDGYFRIVDRLKDMILVSGFNVYPNEVEACIGTLEGVLESAVIGVPDERSGEAVRAYVVRSDRRIDAEAVIAHCRGVLTDYKVPRQIVFRDELPKTPVGKILRKELRAELRAGR